MLIYRINLMSGSTRRPKRESPAGLILKYNSLQDSISKSIKNPSADRQDIMNQIDVLRRKGVDDKKIKSAITSDFKEVYLKSNNKADIQNVLLTAYMYLGESKK